MPETGFKTWGNVAIGLLAIGWLASCSQNVEKLDADEPIPPPPPSLARQLGLPPGGASSDPAAGAVDRSANETSGLDRGTAPGITGEVQLSSEFADQIQPGAVLYLMARKPGGPPVAARRVPNPKFPVRFFLGQESVMLEGQSMEGQVDLSARIAQQGSAGPPAPGDLSGQSPDNPITVGNSSIFTIVLDTRH